MFVSNRFPQNIAVSLLRNFGFDYWFLRIVLV
jgi:hypothetical protein